MNNKNKTVLDQSEIGLSQLLHEAFDLSQGSTGDLLQQMLEATRLYLGMEIAFISQFHHGQRVFRYVDQSEAHALLQVGGSDPVDQSYCLKVVQGLLPELLPDSQLNPVARTIAATKQLGIGAHISVPIYLPDGSLYGTLCAFSFEPDPSLNERDLALMHVLSNIAGMLIHHELEKTADIERIKERIQKILNNNSLSMVWQPIIEIPSLRIVGAEALARFPGSALSDPSEWFADALLAGMSPELEERSLRAGLAMLEHLSEDCYLTLNVSAGTFLEAGVQTLLSGMPLSRIVLEITEHDVISDYTTLADALQPLRQKGLRIAVDDAGAGYASLRHILQLKPNIIKLDMSLVRDIDTDIMRRSLATCMLGFAQEIDSKIVAEGVETQEELDTLIDLGIHMVQGFHLHRPKTEAEMLSILH